MLSTATTTTTNNNGMFPPMMTTQATTMTTNSWLAYQNKNVEPQQVQHQLQSSDRSLVITTTTIPLTESSFSAYDWTKSTEENYKANTCDQYGKYASLRKTLDHTYHGNYTKERQLLQDEIIDKLLSWNDDTNNNAYDGQVSSRRNSNGHSMDTVDSAYGCTGKKSATRINPSVLLNQRRKRHNSKSQSSSSWIVFTAGCMGAGKSWTVRYLTQEGYFFPWPGFVTVDPDQIRHLLPEFDSYAQKTPLQAGEFTRKEAGLISELLTLAALEDGSHHCHDQRDHSRRPRRRNVLVDGSLRDARWYESYFTYLRSRYPTIQIGILFITAPASVIYSRADSRAQATGRVVPKSMLDETMHLVPRSVEQLRPLVDFYAEINNEYEEPQLIAPSGFTWETFRQVWITSPCNDDDEYEDDENHNENINDADDDNGSSTSQQQRQERGRRRRMLGERAPTIGDDKTTCSSKT